MSRVTVTFDGFARAGRRFVEVVNGRLVRDEFKESDHPRAANGQFGSGGTAHIVTTSDGEDTTFHYVGTKEKDATAAHEAAQDDHDDVEYHTPTIDGFNDESSDELHIVHAQDGSGGTDILSVHNDLPEADKQVRIYSEAAWEESGPRRSEVGLSDLEKIEIAQEFNARAEDDGDNVRIKVDDDGDPALDDSGDFQFEQDGEGVDELDEERQADLDALSEELYPGDEASSYPGLEAANEHFRDEGQHELVYRVHTHRSEAKRARANLFAVGGEGNETKSSGGGLLGKLIGGAAHDRAVSHSRKAGV